MDDSNSDILITVDRAGCVVHTTDPAGCVAGCVAHINHLDFHQWQIRLGSSLQTTSPTPSYVSLSPSLFGSDQDLAHLHQPSNTSLLPPSPLAGFSALSLTSQHSLENGGVNTYNRFANNTTASSLGLPSPTLSLSSPWSDSGWVDTNYLPTNDFTFQRSSNHNSPTSSIVHLSPSGEYPYDIGTNYSPVSPALSTYIPSPSYGPNSSPEFLLPNNSSEIHHSYAETFQPGVFPGISSSSGQLPPPSPLSLSAPPSEYLTGVSDPLRDDVLPPGWDLSPSPDPNPYFKLQVTSDAALAVSNEKRKNPPICVCHICGRDFTRKHSYTSHMLSHDGRRTKRCIFCRNFFAGTISRHKKSCKDNPNREPPKKKKSA